MECINKVAIMAIGETGAGKSQLGNAFLQMENSFPTNNNFINCAKAYMKHNTIDGITRYFIDTQGVDSNDEFEKEYSQELISFLKNLEFGINAFFIVINAQNPRFNNEIQKKIKLLYDFYKEPKFLQQIGIIFTKCYPGHFEKEMLETKYREEVLNYINNFPANDSINPQLPSFFVDSIAWDTDMSTKYEFVKILDFAQKNTPLSAKKIKKIDEGIDGKEPKIIEEKKCEIFEQKKEIFKTIKGKYYAFGSSSRKKGFKVHDYYLITKKYSEFTRNNKVYKDGSIKYGEWVQTNEKIETIKE